ncbi:putative long-chain-alcohol O-fatty-acyltransferase 5 [Acorus gramineus]|uniref:Long-chain-alcohol O-fatty-acyltransferase 5 n=1 Tax=Acorus gramineus TaxID=55184 RepID=A0AAV9BCM8_ACOGR|nr:putative long-chain-alcohol O-fatty-acyltransferase 5 [Acorus gramineus]KAK1274395.1 putative long-chain-alcohol O-fatty-acyltransferase 5 [Acorus gramineus]
MESEIQNLMKVTIWVVLSLTYTHHFTPKTTPGLPRLLLLLPVLLLFILLPLSYSSLHLRSISAFFLSWLANFKLLLLSFNSGPLSTNLSLLSFISSTALPIKIHKSQTPPPHKLSIKTLLLILIITLYRYKDSLPNWVLLSLYSLHVYLALEIVLASAAWAARVLIRADIEPQTDAPYLASSLHEFWGRRWNLTVTRVLRPAIYDPLRRLGWGAAAARGVAFLVSGLMHEVMFWYLGGETPTWVVTWFFVVHGVCVAVEGEVGRVLEGWGVRVHRVVKVVLTVGFVLVSAGWWFWPPLLGTGVDEAVIEEYGRFGEWVMGGMVRFCGIFMEGVVFCFDVLSGMNSGIQ